MVFVIHSFKISFIQQTFIILSDSYMCLNMTLWVEKQVSVPTLKSPKSTKTRAYTVSTWREQKPMVKLKLSHLGKYVQL